jgi:uncharacterized protein (DUF1697 family)
MGGKARSSVYVALLRGINVGGHNKLAMSELVGLVEGVGGHEVETYIQSGNVVFCAPPALAAALPVAISEAIATTAGVRCDVIVREGDEIVAVAADHPFAATGLDEKFLHVAFLAAEPAPERAELLDLDGTMPEEVEVRGREVFVAYHCGVGRSKLRFDRLGVAATARNLRTLRKLAEMVRRKQRG